MNSYYNNGYYTPQPINKPNIGKATVNGIEDVKNFILAPNQTYWLKDNLSNNIFEKKADAQGYYTIEVYSLVKQNKESEFVKHSELDVLQKQINELAELIKGGNQQ